MKLRTVLAVATLPMLATPATAWADEGGEEQAKALEISAEIGMLSDYRFRGLSLSGKDFETTASLSLEHESGLYANVWLSNVDLGWGKADDLEADWTIGYSKDVGGITLDGGVIYYSYLGNKDLNYFEGFASVGTQVGPAEVKLGVAYAPSQNNIGNRDNTYVYVAGDLPVSEKLSVHGTFGFEDGAFGNKKKDWGIGASYELVPGLTLGADYIDTAHALTPMGDATFVASIKYGF